MKHSLRILSLILALLTFALMAFGSSSETTEITDANTVDGSSDKTDKDGGTATEEGAAALATIEQTVLIKDEFLTITATEYVNDLIWGEGIKVLIENNDTKDLYVTLDNLIVNDYMIFDFFGETVAAGKKVNSTIYLSSNELKAAGIDHVGKVELYFKTYEPNDYTNQHLYPVLTVQTSNFDKMDGANSDGVELYNEHGIRIVGKHVDENTFWGSDILLYIENNSNQTYNISCDDLSINGFMVTDYFSCTILPGKKAVDEIGLSASSLEENGIEKIEQAELKFKITNPDNYKERYESRVISFNVG